MSPLARKSFYLVPLLIAIALVVFYLEQGRKQAQYCAGLADQFDAQHRQVLQQHPGNRKSRLEALHGLEETAFSHLEQCQESAAVFAAMGDLQISIGQVPLAQLYGEKAIELDAQHWHAHYVLGSALNLQKQYEPGLQHLQRASQLRPDNYSLLVNLCSSYLQNTQFDTAISTCSSVIDKGPTSIHGTAYFLRAQAYTAINDTTAAEKDLQAASQLGYRQ